MISRFGFQERILHGKDTVLITADPKLWPDCDTMPKADRQRWYEQVAVPVALFLDEAVSPEASGAWTRMLAITVTPASSGGASLTREELMEVLGMGRTRYQRVLGELSDTGWIARGERRRDGRMLGQRIELNAEPKREHSER